MNEVWCFIKDCAMIGALGYLFMVPTVALSLYDLPKMLMSIAMVVMVPVVAYDAFRLVEYVLLKISDRRGD